MLNYTVIAYKSSGSTSCRGCTVDSWDSDFEMKLAENRKDAIQIMSEYYYQNKLSSNSEWEINVLFNGVPYETSWHSAYVRMANRAERIVATKYEAYLVKQAEVKAAKEETERQQKINQELEILNRLKAKYEPTQGE